MDLIKIDSQTLTGWLTFLSYSLFVFSLAQEIKK